MKIHSEVSNFSFQERNTQACSKDLKRQRRYTGSEGVNIKTYCIRASVDSCLSCLSAYVHTLIEIFDFLT